jgi:hypothetical protein
MHACNDPIMKKKNFRGKYSGRSKREGCSRTQKYEFLHNLIIGEMEKKHIMNDRIESERTDSRFSRRYYSSSVK